MIDVKPLPSNTMERALIIADKQTTEFQEAEKKIAALLNQASHKNSSIKLDLNRLLLLIVINKIEKPIIYTC